jgi:CO/xanthine dehydrogenase Mo-binding subunit
MRAVQTPGATFALEQVIEQVGEKLELNPIEIREKNMSETGDMAPPKDYTNSNVEYPRAALDAYPAKRLLHEVVNETEWEKKWKGWGTPVAVKGSRKRGIGISYVQGWGGFNFDGFMSTSVSVYPDGSVTILSGSQDLGTGSNTTLCMLAAEYLGIDLDDVNMVSGDTSNGAFDYYEARSSRTCIISGHLVLGAIEDAKRKICDLAASKLEAKPEELDLKGKKVYLTEKPDESIPLSEVITSTVFGSFSGPPGSAFPEMEPGVKTRNLVVTAAEVEVDVETGEVHVLTVWPGTCPGRMINPGIVLGQYRGAAVMGIGMALYENVNFDEKNAVWLSRSLLDYKLPTVMEVPEIKPVVLEAVKERPPYVGAPYGARGAGEWGLSQTVPAIANAIYNATGVRVKRCPMISEIILETLTGGGK